MDDPSSQATRAMEPRPAGAFRPDGSYNPDAPILARGEADLFVRAMVRARHSSRLTPAKAASAIETANAGETFPNFRQWATRGEWAECWTSTQAEEAVKRMGHGSDGHWCGEHWARGAESKCGDRRHYTQKALSPEQSRMLAEFMARFGILI
jgi:hypothetical protein